jgi:hypothetical protein
VLQGNYTQAELRAALAGLDADADEYTNCRQVIRDAQLLRAGGQVPRLPRPGVRVVVPREPSEPRIPGEFGGFETEVADPVATPREVRALASARERVVREQQAAATTRLPVTAIGVLAVGALALLVGFGRGVLRRAG